MQSSQRMRSSTGSYMNGTNGYFAPSSPSIQMGSARGSTKRWSTMNGHSSSKSTTVRDTAMHLKRKSASELGAGISGTADNIGFINLVEWIRSERLHTLPHKGSRWDTVLIRALYFAERLHGFETALKGQAVDAEQAAQLGYGHVKVLLEVSAS